MKKPSILMLSQFFPPETNSASNRMLPMAQALSEHFKVTVSTLRPSYPSPAFFQELDLDQVDRRLPFVIRRIGPQDPHPPSLVKRALLEAAFSVRMGITRPTERFDLVLATSPTMFTGPVGCMLAAQMRAPFIWDVRDVTWHYARHSDKVSPKAQLILPFLDLLMGVTLKRADLVISTTREALALMESQGLNNRKGMQVANGIGRNWLDATKGMAKDGPGSCGRRPIVLYAGLLGLNQELGNLVEAAQWLPEVDFVLAGAGPEKAGLQELARGLGNVSFPGYLSFDDLLLAYRSASILFAQVNPGPGETAIPSKLFECIATGRPLLYMGTGPAANLIREFDLGQVSEPGGGREVAAGIAGILKQYESATVRAASARGWVEVNCCREVLFADFAETLLKRFASGDI